MHNSLIKILLCTLLICQTLVADNLPTGCTLPVRTCTEPGGTKIFAGVKVTLPCWKYSESYTCGVGNIDTCKTLPSKCHIGATARCLIQIEGRCVKADYTYECPTKKCTSHSLYCGKDVFCIDGNCAKQTPTANKHFGQSTAELAAAAKAAGDAAKAKNAKGVVSLFAGHPQECSIAVGSFLDCCKDSGWGHDTHLANCSDGEKKLGKDKSKYIVTYVGEYCHNSVLGVCTSHHKVYCVFDSKLARIVQEYGRTQLGRTFGGAESPDCNGFSIADFQHLNFNVMDFVDPPYFYPGGPPTKKAGIAGDMSVHSPSGKAMADAIKKRIHDDISGNTPSAGNGNTANRAALANAIATQVGER